MESWQIFNAADRILTTAFLRRLYGRSYGLVKLWAADPDTNGRTQRNPIDRIGRMLRELDLMGRGDIARAAIDLMARPLGGRFAYLPEARSDKGTVDGELADCMEALGTFAWTCRKAVSDGIVTAGEREAILEALRNVRLQLDETLDAVEQEGGSK